MNVDHLSEELRCLQEKTSLDDQIETLDVCELAEQYNVSFETLRKQITGVMGDSAVFKVGKKWVIRKRKFLDYLQIKESGEDTGIS